MLAEAERTPMAIRLQIRGLRLELGRIGEHSYSVVLEPDVARALAQHLLIAADTAEIAGELVGVELDRIIARGEGDHV